MATMVEQLLGDRGVPHLLHRVVAIGERAAETLGAGLSDVQFEGRYQAIRRLLQAGELPAARDAAGRLLAESQRPGSLVSAYHQAAAVNLLGQALAASGAAGQALPLFRDAQTRFEGLGKEGARMASIAMTGQGCCLQDLGRLDDAAEVYEQAIALDEQDRRARYVAAGKFNLAIVRMLQGRYDEALAAHGEAREIFAELGEPRSEARAWHQMGMTLQTAGQYDTAEEAYRESLGISVRLKDHAAEASTLDNLGVLYGCMERYEEAIAFHRQAADIRHRLGDQSAESRSRSNMAISLTRLRRYDEARAEIRQAIACQEAFGHAGKPWKTWGNLHDLERAVGDEGAAVDAQAEAARLFLAYRRDGGENNSPAGRLCATFLQEVQAGKTTEMSALLQQMAKDPGWQFGASGALVEALQAMLTGSRDPALAENPDLPYDGQVEVQLLLEALGSG
jgi:tetratricopeptide (TPR) repeat protein